MEAHPRRVVIGLGANLGRPQEQLEKAVEGLRALGTVEGVSSLYRSAAVGGVVQPDFLNAAVLMDTPLELEALLRHLLAIELAAGRERRERWGPRCLDLDILWAGSHRVTSPTLTVPHPRLAERAFALMPLVELAPDASSSESGRSYRDYIDDVLRQQDCKRVARWQGRGWRFLRASRVVESDASLVRESGKKGGSEARAGFVPVA